MPLAAPGLRWVCISAAVNNRSHWYAEGGYDAIAEKNFLAA